MKPCSHRLTTALFFNLVTALCGALVRRGPGSRRRHSGGIFFPGGSHLPHRGAGAAEPRCPVCGAGGRRLRLRGQRRTASRDSRKANGSAVGEFSGGVTLLASADRGVLVLSGASLYRCDASGSVLLARCERPELGPDAFRCLGVGAAVFVGTTNGLYSVENGVFSPVTSLNESLGDQREIRQIAASADGRLAVAAKSGLFVKAGEEKWTPVYPRNGHA